MEQKRLQILIADDSALNRALFAEMLENRYDILEAESGRQAIELIEKNSDTVALLLLDIVMPDLDGFAVLEYLNEKELIETLPVLVISSSNDHETVCKAYELGATDYLLRNSDAVILRRRVSNAIRLFTRQKELFSEIRHRAEKLADEMHRVECTDELTGCNTLREFKRVASALLRTNPDKKYAMWYCDIKQFKLINERFGYEIGDHVLRYWAEEIRKDQKDAETFGRVAGDCFAILTRYDEPMELVDRFWHRVNATGNCLQEKGICYFVEISSGAYLLSEGDAEKLTVSQMMDRANLARRKIKNKSGSGWAFYDETLFQNQLRFAEISKRLPLALSTGEIEVWFQPQVCGAERTLCGAEALCRWQHGTLGRISPTEFIPVLESTGQIYDLDRFIWERTCDYLRKEPSLTLSVNLSRTDLRSPDLVEVLCAMVKKYGISPERLHLEITESAYAEDPEQLIATVQTLQKNGFFIEMDDFGSGFSSLHSLSSLPVDALKLDAHFLKESFGNRRSEIVLKAVVDLARALHIDVIAEGVETTEQVSFLDSIGCDRMQGYHFARPMPTDAFDSYIHEKRGIGT